MRCGKDLDISIWVVWVDQRGLRGTPQIEEAPRVIIINESYPANELFVSQLRLQLLKQTVDDIRQQDETDCARAGTALSAASALRFLCLKILQWQLHKFRSSFRPYPHQIDEVSRAKNIADYLLCGMADNFTLGETRLNMQTLYIRAMVRTIPLSPLDHAQF